MITGIDNFMNKLRSLIPSWLAPTATYIYLLSMLLIFPLFNTKKMFHLYLDKRNYFLVTSIIYICVIFPQVLVALYDWGNDMFAPKRLDIIFSLILVSAFAISTLFSYNFKMTFFEMSSRTISGLCFLFILAVFFAVRQYGKINKPLLWGWIAGSSAIYLCGIMCACGINFLNIQDGLAPEQLPIYLTPLSNTNYNTCYVCLMLPPIMVMYMICKEKLLQKICAFNLYLGFLFTLFIKTESASITIIFGIILLGYFALESELRSTRYTQIVGIYLSAKLTIRILLLLFKKSLHPFHGLGLLLLDYKVLLCEVLCYLIFFIAWKRNSKVIREKIASARKILIIIALIAVLSGIACIIFANVNAENISEESFLYHLVLTDSTFSGRGYIWIRTVSAIKEEPILRKLFGNGLNSFKTLMQIMHKVPVGDEFADPHNEILQMTADMGLLGLIGYFGLLISTLVRGLQNWKKNAFHIMTILTISIYIIQALANEYSIYTLPFLFIFLALINGKSIDTLNS